MKKIVSIVLAVLMVTVMSVTAFAQAPTEAKVDHVSPQVGASTRDVIILPVVLTRIEVTKLPNKTEYRVGEVFNRDGMVVTAYYSNGEVWTTDYFVTPKTPIVEGQTIVEIRYSERGVVQYADCPISVIN